MASDVNSCLFMTSDIFPQLLQDHIPNRKSYIMI
jgi:hypothetical protein